MPIIILKRGTIGSKTIEDGHVLIFPGNKDVHHKPGQKLSTKVIWGGGLAMAAKEVTAEPGKFALSLPTTGMPAAKDKESVHPIAQAAIANLWFAIGAGKTLVLPIREKGLKTYFTESISSDEGKFYEPSFWGANETTANIALADFYMQHLKIIKEFSEYMDSRPDDGNLNAFLNQCMLNEKEKVIIQACYERGQNFPKKDEMPLAYISVNAINGLTKYKTDREAELKKDRQADEKEATFFANSRKRWNQMLVSRGENKVNAANKLISIAGNGFEFVSYTKKELAALLESHGLLRGNSKLRDAAIELLGKDRVKILDGKLCEMKEGDELAFGIFGYARITTDQQAVSKSTLSN